MNAVYYESVAEVDPGTGKSGVRGPLPLHGLEEWFLADPIRRRLVLQPAQGYLPFMPSEVRLMEQTLRAAVKTVSYAKSQILRNWLGQRTGLYLRIGAGSATKWTCSETVVRVFPEWTWPYFRLLDVTADEVVPSGTRLVSVYAAIERLLAAEKPVNHSDWPRARLGYTADDASFTSQRIRACTRGEFSHVFIAIYHGGDSAS